MSKQLTRAVQKIEMARIIAHKLQYNVTNVDRMIVKDIVNQILREYSNNTNIALEMVINASKEQLLEYLEY